MSHSHKVLIVGAGLTGTLTSCLLKRAFGEHLYVEIWDKSRGTGGRMSTTRYNQDSSLSFDLGAQYISATPSYYEKHESVYEELLSNGVLKPLERKIEGIKNADEGTLHMITPKGASSLPKYFLRQSGCKLWRNTLLNGLAVHGTQLRLNVTDPNHDEASGDKRLEKADIIVLTMPVPQILKLGGDIPALVSPFVKSLHDIKYSSRYALGLFYPDQTVLPDVDWCAKYVENNACIRYISIDTETKEQDSNNGMSLVAHSSVPFGIEHLEDSFEEVEPIMLEHLREVLPSLPAHSTSKIIRWRYSQVLKPYEGAPGCFVLNNKPLLVCAGDGFTHSNFDGCVSSAYSVLDTITNFLET